MPLAVRQLSKALWLIALLPSAVFGQSAATPPPSTELIQKLIGRVEQLEKDEVERKKAAAQAEQKIKELQGKIQDLESGRVLPEIAVSADEAPTTKELQKKIQEIERKNDTASAEAAARDKQAPKIKVGQEGFSFSSADTNFVLKVKGLLQLDSRMFYGDNKLSQGNDSFLLRRARPIFEGTVFHDFDFQFVPDFGGTAVQIFDANVNYRFRPELQLKAGKFKGPVGLEMLQQDATLSFNERSLASALVPTRDIGVQLWGDVDEGRLSYAAGVFNQAGDNRNPGNNDFTDDKEFAGRLFTQPFKATGLSGLQGLGFGVGGSYARIKSNALGLPNTTGGTLPGYFTDGQQQFFAYNPVVGTVVANGAHWRVSPQGSYIYGPFGLQSEYVFSQQDVLNTTTQSRASLLNTGWSVSAQWVLTGEQASFSGIVPRHSFDWRSGGWGAWQLVARVGRLDVDKAAFPLFANPANSASSAASFAVGINWWLNKNVRLLSSFSHTAFKGGGAYNPLDPTTLVPPATVSRQDENAFFTRLQLNF